jgi:hypothetical protein
MLGRASTRTVRALGGIVMVTGLVVSAAIVVPATPAGAIALSQTYYVGSSKDSTAAFSSSTCLNRHNTVCTLRSVIADVDVDGSSVEDTIAFSSLPKDTTISLSAALGPLYLDNEGDVTIKGNGETSLFLSGSSKTTLFVEENGEELTIASLTIENGFSDEEGGGAIWSDGYLALDNVNFSNNETSGEGYNGGAIFSTGSELLINGGTYAHNTSTDLGGAVYDDDSSDIQHATFTDNVGENGGGVAIGAGAESDIGNSTFDGNFARDYGDGGGLFNEGDTGVENSTFYANGAMEYGGAVESVEASEVTMYFDSIVDNWALQGGGGVSDENTAYLDVGGDLFMGNVEGPSPTTGIADSCLAFGGFISEGFDMVGPDHGDNCVFAGPGDLTNHVVSVSPLANNGGPTPTVAIGDAAPAPFHVPSFDCDATDQRGDPRVGDCAVGAYQPEATTSATTCGKLSGSSVGTFTLSTCTTKALKSSSATGTSTDLGYDLSVTWHPSGKTAAITSRATSVSADPCGSGFTTTTVIGFVTSSSSEASPYFDRVSFTACVNTGTDAMSLLKGTVAKI